jgi:hypothetical protein
VNRLPSLMYPLSIAVPLWPVVLAMTRSGMPLAAVHVPAPHGDCGHSLPRSRFQLPRRGPSGVCSRATAHFVWNHHVGLWNRSTASGRCR